MFANEQDLCSDFPLLFLWGFHKWRPVFSLGIMHHCPECDKVTNVLSGNRFSVSAGDLKIEVRIPDMYSSLLTTRTAALESPSLQVFTFGLMGSRHLGSITLPGLSSCYILLLCNVVIFTELLYGMIIFPKVED